MTGSALSCRDVSVRYEQGGAGVLSGVSFAVAQGERVALLGLNGSGKTTFLKSLVGLVPHEGEIRIAGTVLARGSLSTIREQIGFLFNVPEDQLLFPKVIDDVAFALVRQGRSRGEASAKAAETLEALGIGHLADASVHHLSHGQTQRVALAGALVTTPGLLLLDEPSAGLDPPAKQGLAHLLAGLDAAMLIATHDIVFAKKVCDRFLHLEKGGLISDGAEIPKAFQGWE
jgi:cobalt/nickel transport system ATP-binding protein